MTIPLKAQQETLTVCNKKKPVSTTPPLPDKKTIVQLGSKGLPLQLFPINDQPPVQHPEKP